MNWMNARTRNRIRSAALRVSLAAAIACGMLLIPTAALADSNQTYNVTGTLASGGTITGTVTIDFTTGVVTTGPGGITVDGTTFICPGNGGCALVASVAGTDGFAMVNNSQTYVFIDWNALAPGAPPNSITLNSGWTYCKNCGGATGYDDAISGIATAVATPEAPEALLLLAGLGALGILAMYRRKSQANA